jgi:catechol 2,3-dioxygenase-like lactoylglutathione lyase family enzyme
MWSAHSVGRLLRGRVGEGAPARGAPALGCTVPQMNGIRGIGQIHVTVSDLDGAIAFYRDVLGLAFLFRVPGQPMAFFDVGGVRLYLGEAESPEFVSHPLLYLRVDDIAAEHARLAAAGVGFLEGPHVVHRDGTTELWLAFFRTPEGHPLALMEERPAA